MLLKIICGNNDLQRGGEAFMGALQEGQRPVANESTSTAARFALISLGVGIAVLALKAIAAWLTGSIALGSDALESVVNVATAIVALVAVRLAARPADAALPYGYGKAEYFSVVAVSLNKKVAALAIFWQAWTGFVMPHPVKADATGIAVSIAATLINAVWGAFLLRAGTSAKSASLVADSRHLFTDVASTTGVIIGVLLAIVTGVLWIDAAVAALVGVGILWSGWLTVRESVIGLMDVAVPPARLTVIRDVIAANAEGAIEAHDIRTRQSGRFTFIEFHLVVPGAMSVEAAHQICDRIELKLREVVGDAQITIHVEPEEKAKHSGIVVV